MQANVKKILDFFQQINAIPRCSKNEAKIGRWLEQWAAANQLAVKRDASGNLLMQVPASPGYENAPILVIQGHMDMVCEKSPDSRHDFAADPIRHVFDGDWLHADNTTLGADNGIALAIAMALATDRSVAHPELELLFTVDEETGLNGAKKLEPGFVGGRVLLNVDSETEGVFTVGCAGGRNTLVSLPLEFSKLPDDSRLFKLTVGGLKGGHSGVDIHLQRANANIILGHALNRLSAAGAIRLASIRGGSAHNAIPRDAFAVFAADSAGRATLERIIAEFEASLKTEYESIEPSIAVAVAPHDSAGMQNSALSAGQTAAVINLILALPHGVLGMSPAFKDVVETSNNLATAEITDTTLKILTSQRSSIMSRMDELTARIKAVAALAGAETESDSEFAPWTPDMNSALLARCKEVYQQVSGREAKVKSIHAGLECAIIGDIYPGMDMISFGPDLEDAHSPNERVFIPSLERLWEFMVALLKSYKSD